MRPCTISRYKLLTYLRKKIVVKLIEQDLDCPEYGCVGELYFKSWVELEIEIEASGGVTVKYCMLLIWSFVVFSS